MDCDCEFELELDGKRCAAKLASRDFAVVDDMMSVGEGRGGIWIVAATIA